MDPEVYKLLEDNAYNEILQADMPPYIVRDVEMMKTPTPEDTLIAFCKIWASYYEAYNNSLVYPDAYAKTMKQIIKR